MKKFNFRLFNALPAHEKRLTLSTLFTLARIVLTPIIVFAMVWGKWDIAFWLFGAAAISDVIDGWLARWCNQQTFLGACLDPIADKFLILSIFFTLAFVQSPLFTIPIWFVVLVLIKELVLIVGGAILYIRQGHLKVSPTALGKGTMFVQVLFIAWLFACYFFHWLPIKTYYVMLGLLLSLVLLSLLQYVRIGLLQLRADS